MTDIVYDANDVQLGFRARILTVSSLPATRAWENKDFIPPNPPADYVLEQFTEGDGTYLGTASDGYTHQNGIYWLWCFTPQNSGLIGYVKDVLALFKPASTFVLPNGLAVHIRGDSGQTPKRDQLIPIGNGYSRLKITIPWYVLHT